MTMPTRRLMAVLRSPDRFPIDVERDAAALHSDDEAGQALALLKADGHDGAAALRALRVDALRRAKGRAARGEAPLFPDEATWAKAQPADVHADAAKGAP